MEGGASKMQKIIGFYKNYTLAEQDGAFYVINRQERKILLKGCEEEATKAFMDKFEKPAAHAANFKARLKYANSIS